MLQNIFGDQFDPLGRHVGFLPVDVPDALVINIRLGIHRLYVVHAERQDVLVIDSVHNGIGVELVAESLSRGEKLRAAGGSGVCGENGGTCESKQVILLEILDDSRVHITELATMTLVKDDDHPFSVDRMILLFLNESGQLLNGGYDDVSVIVLKLLFQNGSGGIAVGRSFFKAVILLHGLVVQVLPVHHKQYLVDVWQL